MNKKLIALLLAGVLAVAGVAAVVVYAQGAEERAFGDAEMVPVLIVTEPVSAGATTEELAAKVRTAQVPRAVLAEGALSDLASLGGEVTNAALMPGEQVLASRLGEQMKPVDDTAVPEGMQTMDVILEAPRVPAGTKAGDMVGVVASYANATGDPGQTRMTLSKVRVVAVKDELGGASAADSAGQVASAVRVTLALTTHQVEKIANAAEFGKVWLSAQSDTTDTSGSKKTDSKDVLG